MHSYTPYLTSRPILNATSDPFNLSDICITSLPVIFRNNFIYIHPIRLCKVSKCREFFIELIFIFFIRQLGAWKHMWPYISKLSRTFTLIRNLYMRYHMSNRKTLYWLTVLRMCTSVLKTHRNKNFPMNP